MSQLQQNWYVTAKEACPDVAHSGTHVEHWLTMYKLLWRLRRSREVGVPVFSTFLGANTTRSPDLWLCAGRRCSEGQANPRDCHATS